MMLLKTLLQKQTPKEHWESVYGEKAPNELTWYQTHPGSSLRLMDRAGFWPQDRFIDVGGGASNLVDHLVDQGALDLTVLDLSAHALEAARQRLGDDAANVRWVEADITTHEFTEQFDFWHDRAVFHFLINPEDRRAYVQALGKAVRPGGHVIIATFGMDGPRKCSGLPVMRYSPASLRAELGADYHLVESLKEIHVAPTGHEQHFIYCLFRKKD
jgi:2-polyprenyl-3-methyl-5-hydroxy-6-metoxy-1,4-benzoquinol methylase